MMLVPLAALLLGPSGSFERPTLELDGEWEFALDPDNQGVALGYAQGKQSLKAHIQVPGSWQGQGFGEQGDDAVLKASYDGVGWYRREVMVPGDWSGKHVVLHVGGMHRIMDVYANGFKAGTDEGYPTPSTFDLTTSINPGATNVIVLRVDGRARPGNALHGSFDSYRPLHGIWGSVEIEAVAEGGVRSIVARPDLAQSSVKLTLELWGAPLGGEEMHVGVGASEKSGPMPKGVANLALTLPIENARLWSPQDPHLYQVVTEIVKDGKVIDRKTQRFGMRSLEARDGKILLNGKPIYLRGLGDDAVFVQSGFPPVDKEFHLQRYRKLKALGFNHIRHHSWCPPDAALEAADELGILFQCELPVASRQDRDANSAVLEGEWQELIRHLWNHPSVAILSMGSALGDALGHPLNQGMFRTAQAMNPPWLILDCSGPGPDDWRRPTQLVSGGQGRTLPDPSRFFPALVHEMGSFNCLADFGDLRLFTGPYRPVWIERALAAYKAHDAMAEYPQWLKLSRELQALARREVIEEARTRRDLSGFAYWMMTDYPGESAFGAAANVGLCDYAFEPRPEVDARVFRRINEDSVVLARLPKRVFQSMERASTSVLISHYGQSPMTDTTVEVEFGGVVQKREHLTINAGQVTELGNYTIVMPHIESPIQMPLTVTVKSPDGFVRNSWDLWVFSSNESTFSEDAALRTVSRLSEADVRFVEAGGSVIWRDEEAALPQRDARFYPGWWNQDTNYGTVIAKHPLFEGFPHDGYCSYPFAELIEHGTTLVMDAFDADATPLIRAIPDGIGTPWNMGFAYEWQVGKGRLIATSLRFGTPETDPASATSRAGCVRTSSRTISCRRRSSRPRSCASWCAPAPGSRIGHCPNAPVTVASYAGTRTGQLIRQTDDWQVMEWLSAPIAESDAPTIALQFRGGLGAWSEPAGTFTLEAAGESLTFDVTDQAATWSSASGKVALAFEPLAVSDQSATGWFTVSLASHLIEPGKALELRARGSNSGSNRWFLLLP
ncbi:MAG: hypothetical protein U1E76_20060 [Planctomycetota bacterium]